jgi:DNA-binding LytR/AlgR family response regulator
MNRPTALIADDEPLLRDHLQAHLARLWPELEIVGHARNGREAVEMFEREQPRIVFLDVHMPGTNGLEAARAIQASSGRRATIVFVTAYEQYAVKAFEQGAIDYLVKPFEELRLADTVQRLKERLLAAAPPAASSAAPGAEPGPAASALALGDPADRIEAVLDRLATQLRHQASGKPWLQWIKASIGNAVRLIPVEQVAYLRSDEKYTLVVWEGGEALIRKPIRELIDELDPEVFVQVHRSVIVNLRHVAQVTRGANETADVQLKGRNETLPVSRSYLHLFRQM